MSGCVFTCRQWNQHLLRIVSCWTGHHITCVYHVAPEESVKAVRHYSSSWPPPLPVYLCDAAHYWIYLLWPTYVVKGPSAPLSTSLSVCSHLLYTEFPNLQMDLCVGFCSSLQDKSVLQRTQTLKWNQFQVANAGCQYGSVVRGDKAIYGGDRRWERLAFLSPLVPVRGPETAILFRNRSEDTHTHKDLKVNTIKPHLSAGNIKSIPFLLAVHLFSFSWH